MTNDAVAVAIANADANAYRRLTPMKKAIIYLRVSTDNQADHGFGLDVQRRKCEAQAVVKDLEVTAVFADEGLSGTAVESDRPGLSAVLDMVRGGEVTAVIVAALDRLGRNTRLVLRLVDTFNDCGVDLISCRESLDTSTPAGKFVLTMFAALSQLERDNIVERTTAGRDARGELDGEKGGRLPYGYERTAVGISINTKQAAVVQSMFELRASGLSLRKIADFLNGSGYRSGRGKKWTGSSVRWVLANEDKYRGDERNGSGHHWPLILTR